MSSVDLNKLKNTAVKVLFLPLVVAASVGGFLIGSRYFENGHAGPQKGTNVKITGLCKILGDTRYPPLQEAEVKVTGINDKIISGVVRETAEPVDCELSKVQVDVLPLFSNFVSSPRPLALTKPGERIPPVKEVKEGYELLNVEVWVTGVCENNRGSQETLVDRVAEVVNAKKSSDGWDLTIVSKIRKEAFNCKSTFVSVKKKIDGDEKVDQNGVPQQKLGDTDYVNKIILVTGDCVPYKSAYDKSAPDQSKIVFIPLTDDPVKIRTNVFSNGKLVKFTGMATMVQGNPLVECDLSKNPDITFRNYDPSTQKLIRAGSREMKNGK